MSYVRYNVPRTGNALVDSMIGETAWDTATAPVKVKAFQWTQSQFEWEDIWTTRGPRADDLLPAKHWSYLSQWPGTLSSQDRYMYEAAKVFSTYSNFRYEVAATNVDADVLWVRTFGANIMPRTQGMQVIGEAPSDKDLGQQTWGYLSSNGAWTYGDRQRHGEENFAGAYDPVGGIGFQNELALVAQTLGLKVPSGSGFGSPFTLMTPSFVPEESSPTNEYGYMKTLGAIEMAAVQALYGVKAANTGNNVYVLPHQNKASWQGTTGYSCLWDSGGIDAISGQNSTNSVTINLNAASLDASDPNGAGYLSREATIQGGYTIANGVLGREPIKDLSFAAS